MTKVTVTLALGLCIGVLTIAGCEKGVEVTGPQEARETAVHLWDYRRAALKASDSSEDALDRLDRLYILDGYQPREACEWLVIGAENEGFSGGLGDELIHGSLCAYRRNPVRGWFWYERYLRESGDEQAAELLKSMLSPAEISRYQADRDKPLIIPQTIFLSDLKVLQERAWLGSAEAALKLYDFHTEYRSQFDERLYWARIAAQNGSTQAQLLTAKLLLSIGDEEGRIRAWFWLNRAAKGGSRDAESLLKKEFPKEP